MLDVNFKVFRAEGPCVVNVNIDLEFHTWYSYPGIAEVDEVSA